MNRWGVGGGGGGGFGGNAGGGGAFGGGAANRFGQQTPQGAFAIASVVRDQSLNSHTHTEMSQRHTPDKRTGGCDCVSKVLLDKGAWPCLSVALVSTMLDGSTREPCMWQDERGRHNTRVWNFALKSQCLFYVLFE